MSERYEEVRRALIARGYLHGRVERFLLQDAFEPERPHALAVTSLKAALLGAPILGALLSASTVAANSPALGARDALVLWAYFAIVSAVALFVLDWAAAALTAVWVRRRGARTADSLRAGLIVAVPILLYLVVAWGFGSPDRALGRDALFLLAATATATLVAWLAGLVSLAGIVGRTGEVPDRKRRSVATAMAILLPIAAVLFIIGGTSAQNLRAIPPSEHAKPPAGGRLLVVGVDGLDGTLVATATEQGATEHLLSLLARGAVYPKRRETVEPAQVWTTIATGMPAEAHGVRQAGAERLPGITAPIAARSGPGAADAALRFLLPTRTVPASGAGRRVRALWEIAGLSGKSAAVGWWASWPARGTEGDSAEGYVVSDRVLARILAGKPEDRDTAPASLYAALAQRFPSDRAAWRKTFDDRFAAFAGSGREAAWESFLIDAFAWRTSSRLAEDAEVATVMTYLPGLDILRARVQGSPQGQDVAVSYVRWLDATVFADLAANRSERIVVVADPGRAASPGAEGFVSIAGGGASARCVGPTVSDLDVAPIVLRVQALPVSREMSGRVPDRCFEGAAAPPSPIATWGRRGGTAVSAENDYDPEMVERLKSLGYLR